MTTTYRYCVCGFIAAFLATSTLVAQAALPYSIRFVYFTPSDKPFQTDFASGIANAALSLQSWYPGQLGGWTILLNDSIVEACPGAQPESFFASSSYSRVFSAVKACFPQMIYNDPSYRWVIYADVRHTCNAPERLGAGGYGVTIMPVQDLEGLAGRLAIVNDCGDSNPYVGQAGIHRWIGGLGHELGHALGLPHPPGCDQGLPNCDFNALMYAGYASYPNTYLRADEKPILLAGSFFFPADVVGSALTVIKTGTGSGTVTGTGIDCGSDCAEKFATGTNVTLTSVPNPNAQGGIYTFAGWGGDCSAFGTQNTCILSMNATKNVSATFRYVGAGSDYSRNYVQKAYVAYYGRAADPGGQSYWAGRMDAEGQSLNAIIGAFGYSDEFTRRYGGLSYTQLVTRIYQQALGRDPDQGGLTYYVSELQAGWRTLQSITLDVLNGATTAPDSTVVANKLDVAAYYTAKVAAGCLYGTEQDGVDVLDIVTALAASVTGAEAAIDAGCGP